MAQVIVARRGPLVVFQRGPSGAAKILAGNDTANAARFAGNSASSATKSQEWAEGPGEPGGPGTKSAKGHADAAAAKVTAYATWVRQVTPTAPVVAGTVYSPTTGAGSANASYQAITLTLTGDELGVRATARVSGTGNALACYYDGSDVFISSETVGTGTPTQYTRQILSVPAAARKVIVCGLTSGPIGIDVLTTPTAQTLLTQAALGNQAANGLASWEDSGSTVTDGSYINANGQVVAAGGFRYLDYDLTGREISYRANGVEVGTATALANYIDANGQSLGQEFVGTGSTVTYTNQALTVPAGTVKIRMSGTTGGNLSLSILRVPSSIATTVSNAVRGAAAANALNAWQSSGVASVSGSYISSTGAAIVNASYRYLDYNLTGAETGFRASGTLAGGATQLAIYLNAGGASLGREFIGTGSNVTYTNQTLTVPAGTTKIRLCANASSSLTLEVQSVLNNAGALIQGATNNNIAVFGDSTATMLAPFIATLYPARTVSDNGIGGQTTQQTAVRMGGEPVTCSGSVTLPTSGTVAVTPSVDLLFSNRSSAWSCRVMVMGIECHLVCAATTGAYTLKPVSYPASALTVPAGTPIRVISGISKSSDPSNAPLLSSLLSGVVVVRCSRNDTATILSSGGRTTILGYMQKIVNQVSFYGGKLLMMTCINGTFDMNTASGLPGASAATAADADSRLSSINTFNAQMQAAWPDQVIDPLGNHIMRGGSTDRTPVSATYAVLNSTVLDTDGLHENSATGRPQTAAFVQSFITARAW